MCPYAKEGSDGSCRPDVRPVTVFLSTELPSCGCVELDRGAAVALVSQKHFLST